MKHLRMLLVLTGVGLMSLVSGCGRSDEAGPKVAVDGLSIVEMDEAAGKLVVTFEKDGRSITYDMRLGPKMMTPPSSDELAANPELPTHEADVRVLDASGRAFRTRIGGDTFIDPNWTAPDGTKNAQVEAFNLVDRVKDMQLMSDAVPALRKLEVPERLNDLRLHAIDMGAGIEEPPAKEGAVVLSPKEFLARPRPGVSAQGNVAYGPSSVTHWDFIVRKKSYLGANHSALHLRAWSFQGDSYVVVQDWESCNHGTCAKSSNMSNHCVMAGFKADDGTNSRWWMGNGCTTPYAWNSGPGTHNCNDDTELQARSAFHDAYVSQTAGSCGAIGAHYWAPGCSY